MTRIFRRNLASLDLIFEFIEGFLNAYRCDDSVAFSIKLAVEELFTNMVKYNRNSSSDISISIEKKINKVKVNLTDHGGKEFDVTKPRETDTTRKLEERKVGGLGLYLVKKHVDDLEYHYVNGESRITFIKNLE